MQAAQLRVLNALLSSTRIERLVEQESLDGAAAYRAVDFLADVRKGIWSEVYAGAPVKVDAYRRNLQRSYVETLSERINGRQASANDARAFFRGELKTLDRDLQTALARVTDRATRLHVEDVRTQVARALDPAVRETARRPAHGRSTVQPMATSRPIRSGAGSITRSAGRRTRCERQPQIHPDSRPAWSIRS